MPRKRDPRRDKAFEIWKQSNGEKKLKDIASELDVSDTQVRKWKSQDKWNDKAKGNVTNSKRNVTKKERVPEPIIQNDDLNDKQQMFCLYYTKYFNATKAYQKAYECDYETAMASGSRLLRNVKIKAEIDRIKQERFQGVALDGMAVLQKYIDIAFADITDFTSFGKKEIEVVNDLGVTETVEVNYVDFKDHEHVDGTIISEVKKGKDGVSIKLADKMKALDFLSSYTDLLSENDKKRLEEEKLKAEIAKVKGEDDEEREDDGFIDALEGAVEVWGDDKET